MAFYYVKSGGTATGDGGRYASEKANNSWATEFSATSEYYQSVDDACAATTSPVADDKVMVSSASTLSSGTSLYSTASTIQATPIGAYSVDDTAIQTYLAGASEDTGGSSNDYGVSGSGFGLHLHGIDIRATDDIVALSNNSNFMMTGGSITLQDGGSSAGRIVSGADGTSISLYGTDIIMESGSTIELVDMANGSVFTMVGGSTSATTNSLGDFLGGGAGSGGMRAHVVGVDLSGHGSGFYLLAAQGGSFTSDDPFHVIMQGCELNASVGFVEESFTGPNQYFLSTNCSSSSTAAEYQFFQRTWAGDVEDQNDSGIHRDESEAFEGGTKVSMKITTSSGCGLTRPLVVDLPAVFSELSSASTDTIRIYLAQANTQSNLTDTNCWAEIYYPDATNKNSWNSASNRAAGILAAGTEHTDDSASSTWLDGVSALTGHDEYRMDVAIDGTDGATGSDSVPIIRIYITSPSATIYIDTTVDVVA
ncbi:MAG: hypothetical protein JKX91_06575 [Rhizobiaceae bacterium]|nr:hypothetical protein [Rhizobiaceae bacterium]